jgi:hypothetical protein
LFKVAEAEAEQEQMLPAQAAVPEDCSMELRFLLL